MLQDIQIERFRILQRLNDVKNELSSMEREINDISLVEKKTTGDLVDLRERFYDKLKQQQQQQQHVARLIKGQFNGVGGVGGGVGVGGVGGVAEEVPIIRHSYFDPSIAHFFNPT